MGDESVQVEVGGKKVGIKGVNSLLLVLLGLALLGAGWLLYDRTTVSTKEHEQMNEAETKIQELIEEQNYMVLSSEEERKAMKAKLHRPSSLSRKLRDEP